ncbi:MAG: aminopeptidase N, partial [Phyllobacteriaceae bacterium]|nr:aminopeptidase N [Phyllobacteriaceae bacterium]
NDRLVLASPETATDQNYADIERVIAHEYFHNWTGNRITCRDWFQLCLKEGLTVFRDQEFTSDVRSQAVKRIEDVRTLRARQYPEDQGPLAHPVRPASYIEINNFYTPTVYEKGAELCRMMQTLIGKPAFRKAMDLYFVRHDGEAATVEDFVRCMADASGRDFTQFFRWYEQAGTPVVEVETKHDAATQTFELTVSQSTPPTPGQTEKLPQHIPLALGLVDPRGNDLPLHLEGVGALNAPLVELTSARQVYRFTGIAQRPVLSLNRGFSAPVIVRSDAKAADHLFLMGRDSDGFNRWESAQSLARDLFCAAATGLRDATPLPDARPFAEALGHTLSDPKADVAFKALMLELPSEADIAARIGTDVNSDHVREGRNALRSSIARVLLPLLENAYAVTAEAGGYRADTRGTGRRSMRFAALSLIAAADTERGLYLARAELAQPANMTIEIGALQAVLATSAAETLLEQFLARHRDDHLLVDKWLALSAQIPLPGASARVEALTTHPLFTWTTPNRVYALVGGLGSNLAGFHAADGEGYRVVADAIIRLNAINPQVAARMATGFRSWRQFDPARRAQAERQMRRVVETPGLSPDVFEIITRTLN